MTKTYSLSDEAIEAVMASEAVEAMSNGDARNVFDLLRDGLGGSNRMDAKLARLRVERVLTLVDPDHRTTLRKELIAALGL